MFPELYLQPGLSPEWQMTHTSTNEAGSPRCPMAECLLCSISHPLDLTCEFCSSSGKQSPLTLTQGALIVTFLCFVL